MLLNHIKSKDLFSNYSEEKGESGFGSQNSQLQNSQLQNSQLQNSQLQNSQLQNSQLQNSQNDTYSQDFLSEYYPSQSLKMYQKYMCEPQLYKSSNQLDPTNYRTVVGTSNSLDNNRMKAKSQDDKLLINTIVEVMKETSTETSEALTEILGKIRAFFSKNENSYDSTLRKFTEELKEFHQTLLQSVDKNKENGEDILKKNFKIDQLCQELRNLKSDRDHKEEWSSKISKEFSDHQSWLNNNLQKLIEVLKEESSSKPTLDIEFHTLKEHKKEFSQLKTFLMKNFKDLERRLISSTDEILDHSANTLHNFSKNVSLRFEQILNNCSRNFEENIAKQFEINQDHQDKNTETLVFQNIKNTYHDLSEKINNVSEMQNVSFRKVFSEIYAIKQKLDGLDKKTITCGNLNNYNNNSNGNNSNNGNNRNCNNNTSSSSSSSSSINITNNNRSNKMLLSLSPANGSSSSSISISNSNSCNNNNNKFGVDMKNYNSSSGGSSSEHQFFGESNTDHSFNIVPFNPGQLRRSQRIMAINGGSLQADASKISQVIDIKNTAMERSKIVQEHCSGAEPIRYGSNTNNVQRFPMSRNSYPNHLLNFGKQSEMINRLTNQETEGGGGGGGGGGGNGDYFFSPDYHFKKRITKKRKFNYLFTEEDSNYPDTDCHQITYAPSQVSSPAISLVELNIPHSPYQDDMDYNGSIFHFTPSYGFKNFDKNPVSSEVLAPAKAAAHDLSSSKGVRKRNKKNR